MDNIFAFFKQWDKLAHTTVSCVLEAWFTMLFLFVVKSLWTAIVAGTVLTLLVGLAKETADAEQEGNYFSWKDFLADSIGTGLILIPLIFIALCV